MKDNYSKVHLSEFLHMCTSIYTTPPRSRSRFRTFSTAPLSQFLLRVTIVLISITTAEFCLSLSCTKGLTQCASFMSSFFCSTLSLRCLQTVCSPSSSLFVAVEYFLFYYMYCIFIHSTVDGHLSCFQFGTIGNTVTRNILAHVILWI